MAEKVGRSGVEISQGRRFISTLIEILIKVSYSLSGSLSPNSFSVFLSELSWLRKLVDLVSKFHRVDVLFQL